MGCSATSLCPGSLQRPTAWPKAQRDSAASTRAIPLAVEREDGYLWSEPKLNRRITLVR